MAVSPFCFGKDDYAGKGIEIVDRKKDIKAFLLGVLCTALIGGGVLGFLWHQNQQGVLNTSTVKKAKVIEDIIDEYYLEDIDEEELEAYLYKGLVAGLGDPYSGYYTTEEYAKLSESTEGEYLGVGVVLQQDAKTGIVTVTRCYEGAPGARAGLLPGDVIYTVNGKTTTDKELSEIVKIIKGSEDKTAHLEIAREGESDYVSLDIPLEHVEVPMVEHEMLEDHIGYIQIYEFAEVTAAQYEAAFQDLQSQGMERLIVDLRDNPGGLLKSVCDILEQILPKGLMVYTEDKNGIRKEYTCDGENELQIPLTVLVNDNSASASEIFSGAVQDYGIGKLVGTTTYGKGIVQMPIPLTDGSAVKLTISKYYTPNGRNIHGTGIAPDVEVELDDSLRKQVAIETSEDNQLQKAIEVVKGM